MTAGGRVSESHGRRLRGLCLAGLPLAFALGVGVAFARGYLPASLLPLGSVPLLAGFVLVGVIAVRAGTLAGRGVVTKSAAAVGLLFFLTEIYSSAPNLWFRADASRTPFTLALLLTQSLLLSHFILCARGAFLVPAPTGEVDRRQSFLRFAHLAEVMISFVLPLLVWELASNKLWAPAREIPFVPPPSSILNVVIEDFRLLVLTSTLASLKRVAYGFLIGAVSGFFVAVACAYSSTVDRILDPIIRLTAPIPPPAWIPFAMSAFPLMEHVGYFLIWLGAFFPTLANTLTGLKAVDQRYVEAAQMFGASKRFIYRRVIIPAALPYVFAGLTIGLMLSLVLLIVAEMVGVKSGIGFYIHYSREFMAYDGVVAGMVWIGIFGLLLSRGLTLIERWLSPWRA